MAKKSRDSFNKIIFLFFMFFAAIGLAVSGTVLFSEKVDLVDDRPDDRRAVLTDPKTGKDLVYSFDVQGDLQVFENGKNTIVDGDDVKKDGPQVIKKTAEPDKKTEEKPEVKVDAEVKPKTEPKPVPKPVEVKKPEVKKVYEKPKVDIKPVIEPVKTVKKEEPKIEPVKAAKVETKTEPKKQTVEQAVVKGNYVLQLLAFQDKAAAIKKYKELKPNVQGLYILKADLGAKGVWYRIRCCKATDSAAAEKLASSIGAKLNIKPMIINLGK